MSTCTELIYLHIPINRRPVELKWFEEFSSIQRAIEVEKQLKGWSRRKKIALIERDWEKLVQFSKNYTQFGSGEREVGASTSYGSTGYGSTGSP